jgi:hypothetical protein
MAYNITYSFTYGQKIDKPENFGMDKHPSLFNDEVKKDLQHTRSFASTWSKTMTQQISKKSILSQK